MVKQEYIADWVVRAQKIAHLGIWDQDPISDELWWSDETFRILGLDPQTIAPSFNKFLQIVHPDDRALIVKQTELALKSDDNPYIVDYRIIRPDKSERIIHEEALIERDEKGTPVKITGIIQDITERKQAEEALRESEEKYRLLLNNLPSIVYKGYKDWSVEFIDKKLELATGYDVDEFNSKKMKWSDIIVKEDIETARNIFIKALKADKSYVREYRIRSKDGDILWIQERGHIVLDKKGEIEFVSGVFFDITDRKLAEEKIKASLKEKEVLLSEIHHRVKNNMQVIISLLKLQSDKIKDKQYIDMFQDSQDRIKTMSLIHEQLYQTKDFANIDFGEHVESLVNGLFVSYGVDINKVSLNIDIKDVSIDLENAIPCGLIINELVSNSLKYAFPQGREGKISIALRPFNEDGLELTVSDDGIGVPEDLDIKQTDTMGLQLVKMLSENQLDGKIELNRTGGTQFNIKFKSTAHKPRI